MAKALHTRQTKSVYYKARSQKSSVKYQRLKIKFTQLSEYMKQSGQEFDYKKRQLDPDINIPAFHRKSVRLDHSYGDIV